MRQAAEQLDRDGGARRDAGKLRVVLGGDEQKRGVKQRAARNAFARGHLRLDGEIDGVVAQMARHLADRGVPEPEHHPGCGRADARDEPGHHQHRHEIRSHQREVPFEPGRLERPLRREHALHMTEGRSRLSGELLGTGRRHHVVAAPNEELIIEGVAQAYQGRAYGRLAEPDTRPGPGDAALAHQGIEDANEVEVERIDVHGRICPVDRPDIVIRFPPAGKSGYPGDEARAPQDREIEMNALADQPPAATTEPLWFLNTLVSIVVPASTGADGISVIEHRAPFGDSPPLHIHRREDEIFHLVSGSLRFVVAGATRRIGAGDTLLAPKGVPHSYLVESAEGAHWLTIMHGGDFEAMLRRMSRRAAAAALPPAAMPTPEAIEALNRACAENGIDIVGPPLA